MKNVVQYRFIALLRPNFGTVLLTAFVFSPLPGDLFVCFYISQNWNHCRHLVTIMYDICANLICRPTHTHIHGDAPKWIKMSPKKTATTIRIQKNKIKIYSKKLQFIYKTLHKRLEKRKLTSLPKSTSGASAHMHTRTHTEHAYSFVEHKKGRTRAFAASCCMQHIR